MVELWGIVIVTSLAVEILTTGSMASIWFTIGAIASLLLALMGVNQIIQITTFVVLSVLTLVFLRPVAAKYLRGNVVATNTDRVIGRSVKVTKAITADEWGEVLVDGVRWSAIEVENHGIEIDKRVRVLAVEGAKLIVKKID